MLKYTVPYSEECLLKLVISIDTNILVLIKPEVFEECRFDYPLISAFANRVG